MASTPSYELTFKVNFEGEVPQSILELLSKKQRKEVEEAVSAMTAAHGATDDHEDIDSDSTDADTDMNEVSSAASDSEEDDAPIEGARAYGAAQKHSNESNSGLSVSEVNIKKEPIANRVFATPKDNPRINISDVRSGAVNNTGFANSGTLNSSSIHHSNVYSRGLASQNVQSQIGHPRSNMTGHQAEFHSNVNSIQYGAVIDTKSRKFKASMYGNGIICRQSTLGNWIELRDPNQPDQSQVAPTSIVVAVRGVGPKKKEKKKRNRGNAVSAIFYHPSSNLNWAMHLPGTTKTAQRATLYAAVKVLDSITSAQSRTRDPLKGLRHVVIKSDNLPVRQHSISGNIRYNGDLFRAIDRGIKDLHEQGIHVQFWSVTPQQNEWASHLADRMLKENISAKKVSKNWPRNLTRDWLDETRD